MEIALVILVVAIIFIIKALKVVPQQNSWVVERLGRFHAALAPGLNIVIPFVDRVAYKHMLKEVPLDVPSQICITKDNTQLQVDGILYFQVTDPKLASYGTSNYIMAITQLAQTTLRSVIGKMELDKTFEERDAINHAVVAALDEAATSWGVKVLRYEIKDLTPPKEILHAMQAQITAEREKRALIAASEGRKQEQINIATGRARSVHSALGRREAGCHQHRAGGGGSDQGRGRGNRAGDSAGGPGDTVARRHGRGPPQGGGKICGSLRQCGQGRQYPDPARQSGGHGCDGGDGHEHREIAERRAARGRRRSMNFSAVLRIDYAAFR